MTRRPLEWWISLVRLCAVPLAFLQVLLTSTYPPGYEAIAWTLLAGFAVGAVVLFATVRETRTYALVAMAFDFLFISSFVVLYAFDAGTPTRQLLFLAIVVGAARFGMRGGIAVGIAAIPVSALFEQQRAHWFDVGYRVEFVVFQASAGLLMALLVGWLVERLERRAQARRAAPTRRRRCATSSAGAPTCSTPRTAAPARSARRSTSTRRSARSSASCAGWSRSTGSRSCSPRTASARMIATAGEPAPTTTSGRAPSSAPRTACISDVVARGQTIYRRDMAQPEYPEEARLLELGLRSRVAAPLLARRAHDRDDLARPARARRASPPTRSS